MHDLQTFERKLEDFRKYLHPLLQASPSNHDSDTFLHYMSIANRHLGTGYKILVSSEPKKELGWGSFAAIFGGQSDILWAICETLPLYTENAILFPEVLSFKTVKIELLATLEGIEKSEEFDEILGLYVRAVRLLICHLGFLDLYGNGGRRSDSRPLAEILEETVAEVSGTLKDGKHSAPTTRVD